MPISGLTDVPKSFLKLGQIRKGAPKGDTSPGKDLDHFRVTYLKNVTAGLLNVDLGELLKQEFERVYGLKPTFLNVRFADDFIPNVWDCNYECYKQGGLIAKAGSNEHGVFWIFYRDMNTMETLISGGRARTNLGQELLNAPIDLATPIYRNQNGDPFFLEPVGRLKVVIPELAHIAVGYFEFRPESPKDILNISAELGAYDAVAKSYGKTISGIPFILKRREEEVTKRIKGKLTLGKSWVVHLDVQGEWGARALNLIEKMAEPEIVEGEELPKLVSGDPVRGHNVPEEIDEAEWMEEAVSEPPLVPALSLPAGIKITPAILVEAKLEMNIPDAAKVINLLGLAGKTTDQAQARLELYQAWRSNGLPIKDAAAEALSGRIPA